MKKELIINLFSIHTAKSTSFDNYADGPIPFVSNGTYNNGIIGYVEPQEGDRVFDGNTISISAFCDAIVQRVPYLPRGNGGSGLIILVPKNPMSEKELMMYAGIINTTLKWKYSYGRMVTKSRLSKESIPILSTNDLDFMAQLKFLTEKNTVTTYKGSIQLQRKALSEYFDFIHGDFHSIKELSHGEMPTVSRINKNNGIIGLFSPPDGATIHNPFHITVSTVTGDAFVQLNKFIATDNVVICKPRINMRITTLIFIAMSINLEKWRWSYGRQC